jgi:hypothetical protein
MIFSADRRAQPVRRVEALSPLNVSKSSTLRDTPPTVANMAPQTHRNLLAHAAEPTLLPPDSEPEPADAAEAIAAARRHPTSAIAWAVLAEQALADGTDASDISAYAFARTGYHRSLDALRRTGWRGSGPVPWEHEPNRGFLRALWALSVAADHIGEDDEAERCAQFLRDSSETAYQELAGS